MKKVLVWVLIILPFLSKAQISNTPWVSLGMDSVSYNNTYGNAKEYNIQTIHHLKSSHHFLAFFIGAKYGWSYDLPNYLQHNHWNVSMKQGKDFTKYVCTSYNNEKGHDSKITMTFHLNDNDRITSAYITGTPDEMIDLFIKYWEDLDISFSKLKKNGSVYIDQASDRISFSWLNLNPVITITDSHKINFLFDKP